MLLVEPDHGIIADASVGACDYYGYQRSDLVGMDISNINIASKDELSARLLNAKTARKNHFHFCHRLASGEVRDVEVHSNPIEVDGSIFLYSIIHDVTEQKRSEIELRESEKSLVTLLDVIPDLVWMKDPEGVYLSCNSKFMEFLDLLKDEIVGKTDFDLFDHSMAKFYRKHDQIVLDSGKACAKEEDALYADGRTRRLEIYKTPVFNSKEELVGVLGVGRDITDRLRAESELKESERLFRATFDQAAVGIVRVGIDGTWLDVNQKFCDIVGYSIDHLRTKKFWEITHPEDIDTNLKLVQELLAGERSSYTLDKRYIKASGDFVWVRLTASLICSEDNAQLYMVGVLEDISARKIAEDKLREAAAVFSSTAEGVLITDKSGTIIDINDAFSTITQYSREEVIGETPRILKSGRHDDQYYTSMWEHLLENGCWYGEIWNRKRSGVIYPEMLTINAVESEDGEVTGYVGVFTDISQIKDSQEQLQHLAHHDPLTGLPNRLLLEERLGQAIKQARRNDKQLAMIFLDLDNFKVINDSLGHPPGDILLREVSAKLEAVIRQQDTVARIGGDEFVLLLADIDTPESAGVVAAKIMSVLQQPFQLNNHEVRVTASLGICLYPQDGEDAATLLRNADAAMYRAKSEGRDNYQYYTEELTRNALERMQLESSLRHAIEHEELLLFYQPQIDLASKKLIGLKALARWPHPEKGMIPPVKFIPMAEQTGLILSLGRWVLKTACLQGVEWLSKGIPFGRIAVNIAGQQLQRGNLLDEVRAVLKETGLPAERLELEITEGFIMKKASETIEQLNAIQQLGVAIAIDDFGTGYSSLSQLKHLPINKLKIDRSFVDDIPTDPDDMAISNAIIALGKSLGLTIIAEGVENEDQAEFLTQAGCHGAQGYLYARPVSPDDLIAQMTEFQP